MAKMQAFNPQTSEVRSPLIAGLSEIASKLSGVLDVKTATMEDLQMPELFISEDIRYKMYEAPLGNKLWLSSPAPVFKKNGEVITPAVDNFTIDYLGGSIVFEKGFELEANDVVTVSATYITDGSNKLDEVFKSIGEVSDIATHYKGFYATLDALMGEYATGVDGDFAIVGEKSSLYVWNSTDGEWTNTFKEYDLEQAKSYTEQAKASAETATEQATNASTSADNAKASETNAKDSETNAKASEDNAKASETASAESATNAEVFAQSAVDNAVSAMGSADEARTIADDISKANKMNCLLNWDFRNPINRNGATSYTGESGQSTFTIDRWAIVGTGSIALSNDCINVTGACDFKQDLTNPNIILALQTQTVTSSVVYHYSGEGAVLNIVCSYSDGSSNAESVTLVGDGNSRLGVVTFNTANSDGETLTGFTFDIIVPDGVTISLCAAKVEIGNTQTLAKMGTFTPDIVESVVGQANYETEYTLCENYARNSNDFVGVVSAKDGTLFGDFRFWSEQEKTGSNDKHTTLWSGSRIGMWNGLEKTNVQFGIDGSDNGYVALTSSDGATINRLFVVNGTELYHEYTTDGNATRKRYKIIDEGNIANYISSNISTVANMTVTSSLKQPNLTLYDGVNYQTVVTAYDDGDTTNAGCELLIGGNGNTFIGAGESYKNLRTQLQAGSLKTHERYNKGTERLYISSDKEIFFETACDTIGNRKVIVINEEGRLYSSSDILSIQDSNNAHFEFTATSGGTTSYGSLNRFHKDTSVAYFQIRHFDDTSILPSFFVGLIKGNSSRNSVSGEVLSSLNRPSGSYTGNDTYPRTINIGGSGKIILLWSKEIYNYAWIATSSKCFFVAGVYEGTNDITFANGVLTIKSNANQHLNMKGHVIEYVVI